MTPEEAIKTIRAMVESRSPDTPNKHYGRKQYDELIECCDTIDRALILDLTLPVEYAEEEFEDMTLLELLRECASAEVESMEDTQELIDAWATADDMAQRMRARLIELKYWWT